MSAVGAIRVMQKGDISEVITMAARIMPFAWSESLLVSCFSSHYQNWVMLLNETIVGFLIARVFSDECLIMNFGVDLAFQRQGLGSRLFAHLLMEMKQQAVPEIWLEVRKSNVAAIAAYRHFGFQVHSERENYYPAHDGREDAIIMRYVNFSA